ncbi:MAG: cytochrome c [Rhizobiales bacterium]|nr:cytochrome c [Hyphomicrobiales bacterium]
MIKKWVITAGLVALGLFAITSAARSDAHIKLEKYSTARQALMQLQSFNLLELAAMVKGEADYDAKLAQDLANNLLAVAKLQQDVMWPQGSDSDALPGKTRALKLAWETYPEIANRRNDMIKAAEALAASAGGGVDALKGTIGDVGRACTLCHDKFRARAE